MTTASEDMQRMIALKSAIDSLESTEITPEVRNLISELINTDVKEFDIVDRQEFASAMSNLLFALGDFDLDEESGELVHKYQRIIRDHKLKQGSMIERVRNHVEAFIDHLFGVDEMRERLDSYIRFYSKQVSNCEQRIDMLEARLKTTTLDSERAEIEQSLEQSRKQLIEFSEQLERLSEHRLKLQ